MKLVIISLFVFLSQSLFGQLYSVDKKDFYSGEFMLTFFSEKTVTPCPLSQAANRDYVFEKRGDMLFLVKGEQPSKRLPDHLLKPYWDKMVSRGESIWIGDWHEKTNTLAFILSTPEARNRDKGKVLVDVGNFKQ